MVSEPEPCPMLAVPMVVALSLKVIVPVALDGLTVAVSITPLPYPDGFNDDVRVVVDGNCHILLLPALVHEEAQYIAVA